MKNHGFTLIELLVVVLIIGILAAIALPRYQVAVERARAVRMLPIMRAISLAQDRYYLANNTYSIDLDELDISIQHGEPTEESIATRTVYAGVEDGHLNLYKSSAGVVWAGKYVTMGGISPNMTCYTENTDSAVGEKVCASLGPKLQTLSDGRGYYQINF